MKLSLFGDNNKVLLVGEGNFSFAVTLAKNNLNIDFTATCYENDVQETGKKNIDILKSYGIRVLLGVNATKLEEHKILGLERFDVIVFNFPHVGGKMRIEKNRELLRKFFMSVKFILQVNGQVFVSLCDGQGGTPADKNVRKWNDSWQVTEMAAHGDFALTAVEPFDSSLFEFYCVTGYRSLEKQFNTKDSLVHIFKLANRPDVYNIVPKDKIHLQNSCDQVYNWNDIIHNHSKDFNEVVLYPNSYQFDITFSVDSKFKVTKFYEVLYNNAGCIIDNVEFIGSYKFPDLKETKTFRITYKSKKFPLHRKLVINLHENIIADIIERALNVTVSK